MLMWHRKLYLIDHGAALYFHHNWETMPGKAESPFPEIGQHVLLPWASRIAEAAKVAHSRLDRDVFTGILQQVQDAWLETEPAGESAAQKRAGYIEFFVRRLAASKPFEQEAIRAYGRLV